jgi:hypothetical protein
MLLPVHKHYCVLLSAITKSVEIQRALTTVYNIFFIYYPEREFSAFGNQLGSLILFKQSAIPVYGPVILSSDHLLRLSLSLSTLMSPLSHLTPTCHIFIEVYGDCLKCSYHETPDFTSDHFIL